MKKQEKSPRSLGLLPKMIGVVVIMWGLSAVLILLGLNDWSDRGTFGDLFGAVNALFSGLAFAGLIYAIVLQKKDLEIQKSEVALNRQELKKSAKAQQQSERALAAQVEQMKISSHLNALNTIINFYNLQINNPVLPAETMDRYKQKRRDAIKEIEQLINRVDDEELD